MIKILPDIETRDWIAQQNLKIGQWGEVKQSHDVFEPKIDMRAAPKVAAELWAFCCSEAEKFRLATQVIVKFDNSNYLSDVDTKALISLIGIKPPYNDFKFSPEISLLLDIEADDNDFYKLSVIIYFIMTIEGHASIVPWLGAWYFRISDGYIYDIQK